MRCSIRGTCAFLLGGLTMTLVAAACSSPGLPNPFTDTPSSVELEDRAWSPDEIVRAEITARGKNDHTAMELIRRLRPTWLRARGEKSLTDPSAKYPIVYIDEIRHGGLSTLHRIPAGEILSMEFYSTADATTRWGTGHSSGVINVVTGR